VAIDSDVTAVLGEVPTDAGGLYQFRAVRGTSGRERVLITFKPQAGGAERHVLIQGFAVRPLVDALLAFMARSDKGLEPKYAKVREQLGAPEPEHAPPPPPVPDSQIPAAQRAAFPWHKR